ncbi:hypothetical protein H5410_051923 [Solanum commersonii]|uniref:Uncharacterized protein n=1 Tax=Solanum commersonii TaxID=4109 RepID=A0A9J5X2H8_SOLCO|nr:hypothetical protein H5410_051923 [Solanum commersonii]
MSINGSLPLPADEEVNFQDLFLVLLLDAPSEGEVSRHVSFRVELVRKKSRRRLKNVNGDSVSNPMSEPSSSTNIPSLPTVRVDLISALAARKRSYSSTCNPLQTPAIVFPDHDLVSSRDRCSKHITSKPSRDTQCKLAKKEVTEFYINGMSDGLSFTSTVTNTPLHLVPTDVAQILGIPSEGWGHYVQLEWPPLPNQSSTLAISCKFSYKPNLTHHHCVLKNEMYPLHHLYFHMVHKTILQTKQRRI